jgi:hypothetical protein
VRKSEASSKMISFQMKDICGKWIKNVKMPSTDQINFRCQVSDLNKEICNRPNLKGTELNKKKEGGFYCNIKLEETPDKYREWKST